MRMLQFRVWDWSNNRWDNTLTLMPNNSGSTIIAKHHPDRYVYQQFTGIRDKNNLPIFEGDIIKYSFKLDPHGEAETHFGEVYYDENCASFLFDKSFEWSLSDCCIIKRSIKVIGNIFQDYHLITTLVKEDDDENLDLATCEQCNEKVWDGYICHSCGMKII